MLEIQQGFVFIDGLDVSGLSRNIVRSRLNMIPQDPVFLPGTVRFNLDPNNEFSDFGVIEALKKVHLFDILDAKGGIMSNFEPRLLSGGQCQLFCLAAAILRKAKIVLLDEVTSR